jgi:hypothetical protein
MSLIFASRMPVSLGPPQKAKIGMKAVLKAAYTNAGKKIPKGAWKINQLAELPELIEKINTGTSH